METYLFTVSVNGERWCSEQKSTLQQIEDKGNHPSALYPSCITPQKAQSAFIHQVMLLILENKHVFLRKLFSKQKTSRNHRLVFEGLVLNAYKQSYTV